MFIFSKLLNFFKIDETQIELNRQRFIVLSRNMPLMYSVLIINVATLSYPHRNDVPFILGYIFPIFIICIFTLRGLSYLKNRGAYISDDQIVKRLYINTALATILAILFVFWTFSLLTYGAPFMHIHVAFFLYISVLSCVFFLMPLPQSAFTVTSIIIIPTSIYFSFANNIVFGSIAINSLLVAIAILFLLTRQYRNFKNLHLQQATLINQKKILTQQKNSLTQQSKKLRQMNVENIKLANMDMLTSLPNRRNFFTQLNFLTKQMHDLTDRKIIVGLLDFDGFKRVNDIYGHPTGDELLICASDRLNDVLGDKITLARLGGDEFGLIISQPDDIENLVEIGQKTCEAMRLPFQLKDTNIKITASIGFVEYPTMALDPQTLFERADYALCYSKQHSKGEPVIFSEKHENIIREVTAIEHQLNHADFDQELSVEFQPIIDIENNRTVGFEALARWNNPILGRVRPDIFIRSAEQTGIIGKLTGILLEKAIQAASQWPEDIYLSFNLSIHDLSSPQTILRLISIVEKSDFPTNRLVFEVTETAVMLDFEQANQALHTLRHLGARIALDDFGTGYSSLSYVQRMPLDRLKIDRSFITDIGSNQNSQNIVKTILDLCKNLNLCCIIEGIETQEQLTILDGMGCRYIQGYYFSRPLEAGKTLEFIDSEIAAIPSANYGGFI